MDTNAPQAGRIIMTATAPNGDTLEVVAYHDGTCGISRNGRPLPGQSWPRGEVGECTAMFLRLAGLV